MLNSQPIPFSKPVSHSSFFQTEWSRRVQEITVSGQFIGGPWVEKLESRLANETQTRFVKTCANGTDALQIALRAVGVGSGDCVLIPDLTFWATFEAVCNVGASPVTVDVDPNDLHVPLEWIKIGIQKHHPKAVILVHLYGWAARETREIREYCRNNKIPLIEDSAQAWGVRLGDAPLFQDADLSTVSFFPGKVLGGAGDGGAIFTQNEAWAHQIKLFSSHGRASKYEHSGVGWNSRLDPLQAAFIDLSMDETESRLIKRRAITKWYREHLHAPGLNLKAPAEGILENGYISVALTLAGTRDSWAQWLDKNKIGYGMVYPGPIHSQKGARGWLKAAVDFGYADTICKTVLNLPCYPDLTSTELDVIAKVIHQGVST